jgi:hypothetical protein
MLGYEAQAQAMQNPPETGTPEEGVPEEGVPEEGVPEEGSQQADAPEPAAQAKRDAFDVYAARGLRIQVTHAQGDIKAGHLVGPDNQRTDTSAAAPLMVFGPNRAKAYKLYRARFDVDGELIDGPYVTGFASLRAARSGIATLFPRQTVAGLSAIPEGELEALRAGWEVY